MIRSQSNNKLNGSHKLDDKVDDDDKLTEEVEELREFSFSLQRSFPLLHWIGYGLLVLILLDYIEILVPPNLRNPAWGFQTLGAMVERVAVPLIGLVLAFYGEKNRRARWEMSVLKFLSWVAFYLGLLYLLLVPWGIFNTIAIQKNSTQQITAQLNQSLEQIQQVEDLVEKATTPGELEQIYRLLDRQEHFAQLKNSLPLPEIKEDLSSLLIVKEAQVKAQAKSAQSSELSKMLKPSLKWNLGALIGGLLFLRIWLDTLWARERIFGTELGVRLP